MIQLLVIFDKYIILLGYYILLICWDLIRFVLIKSKS